MRLGPAIEFVALVLYRLKTNYFCNAASNQRVVGRRDAVS